MVILRNLLSLAFAALLSTAAIAQQQQLGAGQVLGNSTAAQRPARPEAPSAILDRAIGSTRGSILFRGVSTWSPATPGTAGLPWISNGAGADPTYQTINPSTGFASQTAAFVLAAPAGSSGTPSFRLLVGSDLPNPGASSKGGVQSLTCGSNTWFNSLSTGGIFACTQPSFASLTGSLTCAQTPALTGDATTSAGSCATTLATVNSNVGSFGSASAVPVITVDGKGRITAVSTSAISASGVVGPQSPQIRVTVTQGVPVTSADVSTATSLFLEPYNGNQLSLFDGVSTWTSLTVAASTYSLPATQTQTCTLNATVNVSGCTDTSQMTVGQQVTGTNIPASDTIASITGTTTFTLTGAATGSGATSLTFKLPPTTNYDVYAANSSGIKLSWSAAWSNDTTPPTRVLQDGVEVASGATTKRLIGCVRTSTVAGQLADSHTQRWTSNRYNEQPRPMYATEVAATWVGAVNAVFAWRQANANTANQLDWITCTPRPVWAQAQAALVSSVSASMGVGIGIDTTGSSTAQVSQQASIPSTISSNSYQTSATYTGTPGIGHHVATWIESNWTAATQTWIGLSTPNTQQSGIYGEVAN